MPRFAVALLFALTYASAEESVCPNGVCPSDDETSALLQKVATQAARVRAHDHTNNTKRLGCTTTPAYTCGNPSLLCVMDTDQCSSSGGGHCCKAAGDIAGMLQCRYCGEGTDCGPCPSSPSPPPSPPSPDFCGNTQEVCQSCQVCVGGMKSYDCAGPCAINEACGPGDAAGSCPTCADRVKTLVDNGMGVQDAMQSVGQSYGYTDPGCGCLASPAQDCDYCGNTGQICSYDEVCVGGMKSYACAGSCANNEACGPGDAAGSCPTCADRVETLVNNGMGVQDAMASVGQSYGYSQPGCQCMQ